LGIVITAAVFNLLIIAKEKEKNDKQGQKIRPAGADDR